MAERSDDDAERRALTPDQTDTASAKPATMTAVSSTADRLD
jgi:hypothetical protein